MSAMAKKKPGGHTPPSYQHPRVVFHLPQEILDAVDRRAEEYGRTRTSELVMVLRQAYRDMGLLPPKPEGGKPSH
jgi:hypothetical protein